MCCESMIFATLNFLVGGNYFPRALHFEFLLTHLSKLVWYLAIQFAQLSQIDLSGKLHLFSQVMLLPLYMPKYWLPVGLQVADVVKLAFLHEPFAYVL